MSISTNGQICYGVLFAEGYTFPWDEQQWEGDLEHWWRDQCGFQHSFDVYNEQGNLKTGVTQEQEDRYWQEVNEFHTSRPCPVALVNVCSSDYPQYILALPSSIKVAHRGYPTIFDPSDLDLLRIVSDSERFLLFLGQYFPWSPDFVLQWYLSSYWG